MTSHLRPVPNSTPAELRLYLQGLREVIDRLDTAAAAASSTAGTVKISDFSASIAGRLISFDALRAPKYVPAGTTGQILAANATGIPTFQAVLGLLPIATVADLHAGNADVLVTPAIIQAAAAEVTLTDATTVAVPWDTFWNGVVTITADSTLGAPTNAVAGEWRVLRVVQGTGAPNTLSFASVYETSENETLTFSTVLAKKDLVYIFCESLSPDVFYVTMKPDWS